MEPQDDWKKRIAFSDRKLEDLRRVLAQAHSDYKQAKTEYDKALETVADIGGYGNPDGATSVRRTLEKYSSALQRYGAALHDYSVFILGKSV